MRGRTPATTFDGNKILLRAAKFFLLRRKQPAGGGKDMWPPKFSDAIDACNVARRRCERVVTAGLGPPDGNKGGSGVGAAGDCARIPTFTSHMVGRGSQDGHPLCEVCARAWGGVGDALRKHSKIRA